MVLCFLVSALEIQPALGYVYYLTESSGLRQKWITDEQAIPYYLNSSGTNDGLDISLIESAIRGSFQVWDNLPDANFSFQYKGRSSISTITKPGVGGNDYANLVIFDSSCDNVKVSEIAGSATIGVTINSYNPETGEIIESDIIFNDMEYVFTTFENSDVSARKIRLQDVATHEIGHLLGLDHTFFEDATMWPFARDGQMSLAEDDVAGISNLYPAASFYGKTDSLGGIITRGDGRAIMGIYVSAINAATNSEEVAALSDEIGRYSINGLALNSPYYLRTRSVDLKHLRLYIQQHADPTIYIPEYFDGKTSLFDAQMVSTSGASTGYDFVLDEATLLARYDMDVQVTTYLSFGTTTSSQNYMAVRFPASSLPESFNVFGMTFYNNDLNMTWPKIVLTPGTDTRPEIESPILTTAGYVGKELGPSTVEWDVTPLTNTRNLWVVFQMPDKPYVTFGDGPGLGAENGGANFYNDLFISSDGGKSFASWTGGNYDLKVYLTAALTDVSPTPVVIFETNNYSFGTVKVGATVRSALPISNSGGLELTLSEFESNKPSFFVIAADHTTIQVGGTDTLRLTFTPKSNIAYDATLGFLTTDPSRPAISISATGTGAYPAASVAPLAVDFGTLEVGESSSRTVTLSNTSAVGLWAWGFASSSAHFTVSRGDTLKIAARDSAALAVDFAPADTGTFSGILSFTTDDPAHSRVEVSLAGAGKTGDIAGCTFPGDANLDGRVDIFDLLKMLSFVSRKTVPSQEQSDCADLTGDGRVDIFDVLAVLKIIAGKKVSLSGPAAEVDRPALAAELVALGVDETTIAEIFALLNQAGAPAALPRAWSLNQNAPNPFNPSTSISYSVPEQVAGALVSLRVYDLAGRLVKVLAEGPRAPGDYTVFWDGASERGGRMPSGVYFYRLTTGDGRAFTRKMVLVK